MTYTLEDVRNIVKEVINHYNYHEILLDADAGPEKHYNFDADRAMEILEKFVKEATNIAFEG